MKQLGLPRDLLIKEIDIQSSIAIEAPIEMVATFWILTRQIQAVERPAARSKSLQKQDKRGQLPKAEPASS